MQLLRFYAILGADDGGTDGGCSWRRGEEEECAVEAKSGGRAEVGSGELAPCGAGDTAAARDSAALYSNAGPPEGSASGRPGDDDDSGVGGSTTDRARS